MNYPKFLCKNDKIAYVAPSCGCAHEPYYTKVQSSIKVMTNRGYKIECGPNVYKDEAIGRSNTATECAKEINHYFNEDDCSALLSVGGGELMVEILPYVDFNKIKNNPKWFMGYSDNTNLTYLLTTICDMASIYGPNCPTFGVVPHHKYLQDALGLLEGTNLVINNYDLWEKSENHFKEDPLALLTLTEPCNIISYPTSEVEMKGRLLGGCIDVLITLIGSKFDKTKEFIEKYQSDGIVWFLEACDLNNIALRRALIQMDQAGWFKNMKGIIFGRPLSGMNDFFGMNRFDAVTEVIGKYNVPILFDVDLGHLPPSMPIITGSIGTIEYKNKQLTLKMELK